MKNILVFANNITEYLYSITDTQCPIFILFLPYWPALKLLQCLRDSKKLLDSNEDVESLILNLNFTKCIKII